MDIKLRRSGRSRIQRGADDWAVSTIAYLAAGVFALVCFVPFLLVIVYSFTPFDLYLKNHFDFFPERYTLDAYRMVLDYPYIWSGYRNTLIIASVGTVLSMILLVLTAYPLTKKDLKGGKLIMMLWIVTMFFSGGMIPDYFLVRSLGLLNTRWALILPGLLGCYNLILMRNYIEGLPSALEEAALIDGANDLQVLVRIVLPLCLPILATLGLFTIVGYWNSYFSAIMYMTKRNMWPLQLVLREIIFEGSAAEMQAAGTVADDNITSPFLLRMASIVVATVPIMLVYPFLQKYFMSGLVLGGVKE
ncbi:MAG: carbohydrate ABC transporter permease [Clostridia bacterium]|nr:carbohydrate ABC transporter permease [Clostridia bacterium]